MSGGISNSVAVMAGFFFVWAPRGFHDANDVLVLLKKKTNTLQVRSGWCILVNHRVSKTMLGRTATNPVKGLFGKGVGDQVYIQESGSVPLHA